MGDPSSYPDWCKTASSEKQFEVYCKVEITTWEESRTSRTSTCRSCHCSCNSKCFHLRVREFFLNLAGACFETSYCPRLNEHIVVARDALGSMMNKSIYVLNPCCSSLLISFKIRRAELHSRTQFLRCCVPYIDVRFECERHVTWLKSYCVVSSQCCNLRYEENWKVRRSEES